MPWPDTHSLKYASWRTPNIRVERADSNVASSCTLLVWSSTEMVIHDTLLVMANIGNNSNAFFSLNLSQKPTFSSQPQWPCENQRMSRWMRSLCLYWINQFSEQHVCDIMEESREERLQHLPLASRAHHGNQHTNRTKNVEWMLSSVLLAGTSLQSVCI